MFLWGETKRKAEAKKNISMQPAERFQIYEALLFFYYNPSLQKLPFRLPVIMRAPHLEPGLENSGKQPTYN